MICVVLYAVIVLTMVDSVPMRPILNKKHAITRTTELCSGNPCVDILSSFCPSDTHICIFSSKTCKVSCQPKALPGSVSTNKLSGHEGLFPAATLFEILFPSDPDTSTKSTIPRNQQKVESPSGSRKRLNLTHSTQIIGGIGTWISATVG